VVVAAFNSPLDNCETWAHELDAVLRDPERRERTISRARAIAAQRVRPDPREIVRQMVAASMPGRKVRTPSHDEVVNDSRGKPLFRVRHLASAVAFVLPMERISAPLLTQIKSAVAGAMEGDDEKGELKSVTTESGL
jgi:hypothetical protein